MDSTNASALRAVGRVEADPVFPATSTPPEIVRAEIEAQIAKAFAFAERSPFPSPAALMEDVYGE